MRACGIGLTEGKQRRMLALKLARGTAYYRDLLRHTATRGKRMIVGINQCKETVEAVARRTQVLQAAQSSRSHLFGREGPSLLRLSG